MTIPSLRSLRTTQRLDTNLQPTTAAFAQPVVQQSNGDVFVPGSTPVAQAQGQPPVNPAVFPYPPGVSTPEEALARLEAMRDHWQTQPPPLNNYGAFPAAYIEMTEALLAEAARYEQAGDPAQAAAIRAMVPAFANEYFEGFAANQANMALAAGQPVPAEVMTALQNGSISVPGSWQAHFNECLNPNASVSALLGTAMNAHILYDLPRVIRDLSTTHPDPQVRAAYDVLVVDSGNPRYQQARNRFLEYGNIFGQAAGPITDALTGYFGVNEVTVANAVAGVFGVAEGGVTGAVGLLRGAAFEMALSLHLGNITPAELDAMVARYSPELAANLDIAVDNLSLLHAIHAGLIEYGLLSEHTSVEDYLTPVPAPTPDLTPVGTPPPG